jgi:hypothetical protein
MPIVSLFIMQFSLSLAHHSSLLGQNVFNIKKPDVTVTVGPPSSERAYSVKLDSHSNGPLIVHHSGPHPLIPEPTLLLHTRSKLIP